MPEYELTASCALGLEAVAAREMRDYGFSNVRVRNGWVDFSGEDRDICEANMWLRTIDRVWIKMAEFSCRSFEDLYQGMKMVSWADYMPGNACFPVDAHTHSSRLTSLPAIQRTAKKAAVEVMQDRYRSLRLPEDGALFPIKIFLVNDACTVLLDTSGTGLHRRGYHTLNSEAPLRETLAAGLVLLSYWNKSRALVDPFCGSGTIVLEAAMIALDRAPGLKRSFAFERWPFIDGRVLSEVREEAEDLFDRKTVLDISGFDINGKVLGLARAHLAAAGLEGRGIHFQEQDVRDFSTRKKYGVIITNPPYGERMLEKSEAEDLYAILGGKCQALETWSHYVISPNPDFEKFFGMKAARRRKLHNGLIPCSYYQFPGPKPS